MPYKDIEKRREHQRNLYQEHRQEELEHANQYYQSHSEKWQQRYLRCPLRHVWHSMKYRCFNEGNKNYPCYGGRGISICDEWLDYETFEKWALANGWQHGLTIDRINNDGNYEPSNVQFITQSDNTKRRFIKAS